MEAVCAFAARGRFCHRFANERQKFYNLAGEVPMTLDDYIEIMLIKVKISRKKMDKQLLHWLLELRTLRGQVKHLEDENKRLKQD